MLSKGQEDENGILFVCFPITGIAAVLSRSPMTVKRSLNELETAGLALKSAMNFPVDEELKILINEEQNLKLTSDKKEVSESGVNYETIYQGFLHISPDLKSAEYEVERARYDYKIAK